ncbi:hypothetical protein ELH35_37985 [Rhizobium ruizarguesonis]|uniref:Uncharacterized protein n=1 Tax=Rhizobium ruizarguesonis TaxID=2081791 RepID=A0AAE8TXY6_9HYPH|nr:hypothetical protein ELH35_37985 [Rhizobium ruizarguesonis]TBF00945.1 hypothetical protein ELG94_39405 [Rhizobium ruizarguesonis]
MWSPFVLSKQTESQLADFTQLFFGQALRRGLRCVLKFLGRNVDGGGADMPMTQLADLLPWNWTGLRPTMALAS